METVMYLVLYMVLVVFGAGFLNHFLDPEELIDEWEDDEV